MRIQDLDKPSVTKTIAPKNLIVGFDECVQFDDLARGIAGMRECLKISFVDRLDKHGPIKATPVKAPSTTRLPYVRIMRVGEPELGMAVTTSIWPSSRFDDVIWCSSQPLWLCSCKLIPNYIFNSASFPYRRNAYY